MDEFIGTIKMFAGDFAPVGWLLCNGQQLNVKQYEALFLVLGTKYGGDGRNNFNLPDFRDRVAICASEGLRVGTKAGQATIEVKTENIPTLSGGASLYNLPGIASGVITGNSIVNISIPCNDSTGATTPNPVNNFIATSNTVDTTGDPANMYSPTATANKFLKTFTTNVPINITANIAVKLDSTVAEVKVNTNPTPKPISNMQPSLAVHYIICYEGMFPVENN